jgi:hypothetical protein
LTTQAGCDRLCVMKIHVPSGTPSLEEQASPFPDNSPASHGQGNHSAVGGPGRPSGVSSALRLRIQRVARMRVAGIKDSVIQLREGITAPAFHYLINLPEYKEVEEALFDGTISAMDRAIAGNVETLRHEVRSAVPAALRTVIEVANQRRDLKTALAASLELLDRDPDRVAQKSKLSEIPIDGVRLPDNIIDQVSKEADNVVNEVNKPKQVVQ